MKASQMLAMAAATIGAGVPMDGFNFRRRGRVVAQGLSTADVERIDAAKARRERKAAKHLDQERRRLAGLAPNEHQR